jgi:hypothetical protein
MCVQKKFDCLYYLVGRLIHGTIHYTILHFKVKNAEKQMQEKMPVFVE